MEKLDFSMDYRFAGKPLRSGAWLRQTGNETVDDIPVGPWFWTAVPDNYNPTLYERLTAPSHWLEQPARPELWRERNRENVLASEGFVYDTTLTDKPITRLGDFAKVDEDENA